MPYVLFHEYFPGIAKKETRSFTTLEDSDLPIDSYSLIESYCDEPGCDCRRVFFSVFSKKSNKMLAVIAYGWENEGFYSKWFGYNNPQAIKDLKGPALNLASPQSELAPAILKAVEAVLKDNSYIKRIKSHYELFKDFIENSANEKQMLNKDSTGTSTLKVGRNAPCPCGSGKKYKKCCMLKPQTDNARRGVIQSMQQPEESRKPDKKENIFGESLTNRELKKAEALVTRVARRLQRDTEVSVIDQGIRGDIADNPYTAFALLHLLLKVHAPKGHVRETSVSYQACLILLEEALTEIRYSVDRNRQWAIDTEERIQKQIADQAFQLKADTRVQSDLVQALYNARMELNPEIKAKSEQLAQYYSRFATRTGPPDLERLFDRIAADCPDNPFELHERVMADLTVLPIEGQLSVIAEMARARNPLIRELAAFMLLHPNHKVRSQVPTIFHHMVSPGTIAPVTLRRMIGLRNWLPKAERPALDEVIKKIRLARVECAPMPLVQSVEVYVSPFDGSGIQGAWAVSRRKRHYQVASVLVCQGKGIHEAWAQSDMSKGEVKSMVRGIRQNVIVEPVHPTYLERLISHFIWQGIQQDNPPPPALLQVAETMGSEYWHPQPMAFEKEFARMEEASETKSLTREDIIKVLEESGDWPEKMKFANSWFEDDARVDDLLKKNVDFPLLGQETLLETIEQIIEKILNEKSEVWSERLLWMALWAKSCKGLNQFPWENFYIVTRELQQGTPLEQIPLMVAVAERSIYSALRRIEWPPE